MSGQGELPPELPHWEPLADRLAAEAKAEGRTDWFERLYAAAVAGEVALPWSRLEPDPLLVGWAESRGGRSRRARAVVVGSGLGADAEFVSMLGYDTDAFDLSPTAIAVTGQRFPRSSVRYRVADLFELPEAWRGAFDLVVDVHTVQALPPSRRSAAVAAVRGLVAPGGTLVGVYAATQEPKPESAPPPWPLTPDDVGLFPGDDVRVVSAERPGDSSRWLVELRRSGVGRAAVAGGPVGGLGQDDDRG